MRWRRKVLVKKPPGPETISALVQLYQPMKIDPTLVDKLASDLEDLVSKLEVIIDQQSEIASSLSNLV